MEQDNEVDDFPRLRNGLVGTYGVTITKRVTDFRQGRN